jgi:hypothetical protein
VYGGVEYVDGPRHTRARDMSVDADTACVLTPEEGARDRFAASRARVGDAAPVPRAWVALNLGLHRSWTDRFVSFGLVFRA